MKKIHILICLLASLSFTALAQTSKDFKISSIKEFPVIGSKKFVFKTNFARSKVVLDFNLLLTKHEVVVVDSTAFILFSLKNDSSKEDKEIPSAVFNTCQFDKHNVEIQNAEIGFSDGSFFCGPFQKVIKELISTDLRMKDKNVYFLVLNSYDYDKVLYPYTCKTVKEAIRNWKIVGALHNSKYVYCFGILKNGVIMLDERDCPNYPHDNLLGIK